MKRYRNLFDRVASPEALFAAFFRVRRGKRYRLEADAFFTDLEPEIFRLSRELYDGSYQPGAYRHFYIREPKLRLVSAAPFRDRVLHHAIHAVLEPIFEPRFIFDTYACRVGKGQHRALDRFTYFARRHEWVARFDVRRFFPTICHRLLVDLLARTVTDSQLLDLIRRLVASGAGIHPASAELDWFPGDGLWTPLESPRGIPIGNLTSQLFANLYLAPFDEYVKRQLRWPAYLRFMDDVVFFAPNRQSLLEVRARTAAFLETWRLRIHPDKSFIARVGDGAPYLGFKVFPDHRLLLGKSVRRFGRRLRHLQDRYCTGRLPSARLRQSIVSWIGHARHGDTFHLRDCLLSDAIFVRPSAHA
jgi:hypothetical protein